METDPAPDLEVQKKLGRITKEFRETTMRILQRKHTIRIAPLPSGHIIS